MPLLPGSDERTIQRNIEELIRAGYPPAQAEAIARAHARRAKR